MFRALVDDQFGNDFFTGLPPQDNVPGRKVGEHLNFAANGQIDPGTLGVIHVDLGCLDQCIPPILAWVLLNAVTTRVHFNLDFTLATGRDLPRIIDSGAPSAGLDLVDPQVHCPKVFDREFMYNGNAIDHGRKIIGGVGENRIGCTGLLGRIGRTGRGPAQDERSQQQAYYQSNLHFTFSSIFPHPRPDATGVCMPNIKHAGYICNFPTDNIVALRLTGFPLQVNDKQKTCFSRFLSSANGDYIRNNGSTSIAMRTSRLENNCICSDRKSPTIRCRTPADPHFTRICQRYRPATRVMGDSIGPKTSTASRYSRRLTIKRRQASPRACACWRTRSGTWPDILNCTNRVNGGYPSDWRKAISRL